MRFKHTLSGLVVTALVGLAPMATAPTATAAEASVVDRAAVSRAAETKPKRTISSKIVETKRNRLVFKGNVSPGHARKPVFIQKRDCKKPRCDWHLHNKVRTNKKGGFSSRVTAPRKGYDYWRAKVKAHGGYGTSYSDVWRTYTI